MNCTSWIKINKKIKVIQHGNNYDLIEKKYHTGIEHEYIFQNELYTWGWSNNKNEIKVTSPRLMNFKRQFQKFKKKIKKAKKNFIYRRTFAYLEFS